MNYYTTYDFGYNNIPKTNITVFQGYITVHGSFQTMAACTWVFVFVEIAWFVQTIYSTSRNDFWKSILSLQIISILSPRYSSLSKKMLLKISLNPQLKQLSMFWKQIFLQFRPYIFFNVQNCSTMIFCFICTKSFWKVLHAICVS